MTVAPPGRVLVTGARGQLAGTIIRTLEGAGEVLAYSRQNLDITNGLIMSEAVMMGLGAKMGRNYAHDVVYDVCREVVKTGTPLLDLLVENDEIRKHADRKTLEKLMDPANYLGVAGPMVDRVLKGRKKKY